MTFLRYKYTGNIILIVWCSFSRKSQVIRKKKNQLIRILLIHRSGIKTVYGCSVIVNVSFVYKMYFYSLELCFFIVLPRFFQIFSIFLFIFISKRHNPWDILFFIFSPVFLFSDGFSLIFFILQARLHIFCFLSIYLISL